MLRALAQVVVIAIAACTLDLGDAAIDGWPIGAPVHDDATAAELVRVGLAGLDDREPGHPPVVRFQLHHEGAPFDPTTGEVAVPVRSGGCCLVLRIALEDGSMRAIGVGYPCIGERAVAVPWGP